MTPPRSRMAERAAAAVALLSAAALLGVVDIFLPRERVGPDLASEPGFFVVAGAAATLAVYGLGRAAALLLGRDDGEGQG